MFFTGGLINLAQAQGTTPAPLFQNATITGSGSTITATRVPVVLSSTLTVYVDLTIQFNSDSNGNLTIATGFPQAAPSPTPITGNFVAGTYLAPSNLFNGKGYITVSGPTVGDGGATLWSLTAGPNADPSLYLASANWWVGPVANNPYAARINDAKITSTTYSYGISTYMPGACVLPWCADSDLIGVSQTGSVLSIATFSNNGENDQNTPYAILTFTKQ
jgi:hypothetical protein